MGKSWENRADKEFFEWRIDNIENSKITRPNPTRRTTKLSLKIKTF
jgi:hypothetical protein